MHTVHIRITDSHWFNLLSGGRYAGACSSCHLGKSWVHPDLMLGWVRENTLHDASTIYLCTALTKGKGCWSDDDGMICRGSTRGGEWWTRREDKRKEEPVLWSFGHWGGVASQDGALVGIWRSNLSICMRELLLHWTTLNYKCIFYERNSRSRSKTL